MTNLYNFKGIPMYSFCINIMQQPPWSLPDLPGPMQDTNFTITLTASHPTNEHNCLSPHREHMPPDIFVSGSSTCNSNRMLRYLNRCPVFQQLIILSSQNFLKQWQYPLVPMVAMCKIVFKLSILKRVYQDLFMVIPCNFLYFSTNCHGN